MLGDRHGHKAEEKENRAFTPPPPASSRGALQMLTLVPSPFCRRGTQGGSQGGARGPQGCRRGPQGRPQGGGQRKAWRAAGAGTCRAVRSSACGRLGHHPSSGGRRVGGRDGGYLPSCSTCRPSRRRQPPRRRCWRPDCSSPRRSRGSADSAAGSRRRRPRPRRPCPCHRSRDDPDGPDCCHSTSRAVCRRQRALRRRCRPDNGIPPSRPHHRADVQARCRSRRSLGRRPFFSSWRSSGRDDVDCRARSTRRAACRRLQRSRCQRRRRDSRTASRPHNGSASAAGPPHHCGSRGGRPCPRHERRGDRLGPGRYFCSTSRAEDLEHRPGRRCRRSHCPPSDGRPAGACDGRRSGRPF